MLSQLRLVADEDIGPLRLTVDSRRDWEDNVGVVHVVLKDNPS